MYLAFFNASKKTLTNLSTDYDYVIKSSGKNWCWRWSRNCCDATPKRHFIASTPPSRFPPVPYSKIRKSTTCCLKREAVAAAAKATVSFDWALTWVHLLLIAQYRLHSATWYFLLVVLSTSGNNGSGDIKGRSRYNGRQVQSWKQDVIDKYEKKKEELIARHHHEVSVDFMSPGSLTSRGVLFAYWKKSWNVYLTFVSMSNYTTLALYQLVSRVCNVFQRTKAIIIT